MAVATPVTLEDIANVCKLLERLRMGELNLIPATAAIAERKDDAGTAMLRRVEALLSEHLQRMQEPLRDGGAAFPIPLDDRPGAYPAEPGMSLRDYFIAHAPTEPQQWFSPTMPEVPRAPEALKDLTDSEREDSAAVNDWSLDMADVRSPRLRDYLQQREAHKEALQRFNRESARERYLQWPAAWADAMLKARSE